jgi:hypothetical protein
MSQGRYVSGELVRSVYVVNMSSGGGSGTPGGSDTQIQFNNAGVFGGVANSSVNNATGNITLGSRVSVPLGTAALPSIYPGTDTNTGIYSPGVGQLAVATNGTGRLFINATGKVGIGTTSTGEALQVAGNIQVQANGYVNAGSSAAEISLFAGGINVGSNRGGQIDLVGGNASSDTGIIRFRTGTGAGGTAQSERARIDSSGRLLVGTSSARTTLFNTAIAPPIQVEGTGLGDRFLAAISSSSTGSRGGGVVVAHQKSGTLNGNTALAEQDSAGLVSFQGNDATNFIEAARIEVFVDGTPGTNDMPGRLVFSTTADGASSPTERLHINSVGQTMVNSAGTAAAPVISKVDDTNTGIFFPAADTIAFAEGGVERARIDSSGRLLVGTSTALSTDSIFQVKSSNPANVIEISRRANDSSPARFNFSKTRGDATDIVLNNDTIGEILFRASDGVVATPIAAGISTHVDGTPGPNDMPGRLVFSTTADGASSPTERMRITSDAYVRLAAGTGGIQFNGDTAAANALDDYEEGTWTPTLTLSSTQFTAVNYNSWTKGYYRKIGSLVHVQGVLITNDIDAGPGAGAVRIGGLPFASPANSSGENFTGTSSISVGFADAWTSVQPSTAEVVTNSSLIALYAENATGERTALTAANVTDANFANVIRFAGTYISV